MVVGYRLQPLSFAVAKALGRVPHVAVVNLIAGERAVPELIQGDWNSDRLAAMSRDLLAGESEPQLAALARVRQRLGPPGASLQAAEAVLEYV